MSAGPKSILAAVLINTALTSLSPAQTFSGLGPFSANGISKNGQVVVGRTLSGGTRAAKWTSADGIQPLAILQAQLASNAFAVSADGSVIVGYRITTSNLTRAVIWTSAGAIELAPLPGDANCVALDVSGDGSVTVGFSALGSISESQCTAVVWMRSGAPVSLGLLPGTRDSMAVGVNQDGTVIVGWSGYQQGSRQGFRWASASGLIALGNLPRWTNSSAAAVAATGGVVVGTNNPFPVRWSDAGTVQNLGIPAEANSMVKGASAQCESVVGFCSFPHTADTHAFLWSPTAGSADLNSYLPTLGVSLTGWALLEATGISGNGRAIIGNGVFAGQNEGWIATVPGCGSADFNHDGASGTDADIEAFFSCLAGNCCTTCDSEDFNGDGDSATDADIEAFFRVLAGGNC